MNWYKKTLTSENDDELNEFFDLQEAYEHARNSFTDKATKMLPERTTNIRTLERGRCARGKTTCPYCKATCEVSVCSDVGGVWWNCPKCGLVD